MTTKALVPAQQAEAFNEALRMAFPVPEAPPRTPGEAALVAELRRWVRKGLLREGQG